MAKRAPSAGALSSFRLLFSTAAETDRRALWGGLGLLLLSSALRPLYPLLLKVLIDGATQGRSGVMTTAAVSISVVSTAGTAAGSYASMILWNLWERMTITVDQQLVRMNARLARLDELQDPAYVEHLTLVRRNRETFQESVMAFLYSTSMALQVLVTVAILVAVQPLLLLLPLFSAAPIAAARWGERRAQRAMAETAEAGRTADAYYLLGLYPREAAEVRVLRLRELLVDRHRALWRLVVDRQWRVETLGAVVSAAALLLFTLGFAGAVLLVTVRSVEGAATLGSVILVLTAGQQLHTQVGGMLSTSGALFRILDTMRHYSWLGRYVAEHEVRTRRDAPEALRSGIRLEGVSFRYPEARSDAVRDVSFTLPAGSVVAVVGENGAGKSTLVSLLCGLHRPTSGRIVVDGVDAGELDVIQWRSSLSGAFQDFVRYELLVREAVGVGAVERIEDAEAVRTALRRADVADLEFSIPEGLETPLGRAFLEGIELSGGQWQKVALARAMMRSAPLVLVLDEPTYSLDVESERRVFEWFSRIADAENPAGTITVIVSHRFSTVRSADLVAVLQEGRLVELGTHEELLAANGHYAAMYRTQAEGYA